MKQTTKGLIHHALVFHCSYTFYSCLRWFTETHIQGTLYIKLPIIMIFFNITNLIHRTKQINWRNVTWSFMEVVGVIFYISFIFERLLKPEFQDFGKRKVEPKALIVSIFNCMMPATLAMLCCFFCLLHSWHNAFAEMMCFADRMFYKARRF